MCGGAGQEFFNYFLEFSVRFRALNNTDNSNIRRSGIQLPDEKQWSAINAKTRTFCNASLDRVRVAPRTQAPAELLGIEIQSERTPDKILFLEMRLVLKERVVVFPIPLLVTRALCSLCRLYSLRVQR